MVGGVTLQAPEETAFCGCVNIYISAGMCCV